METVSESSLNEEESGWVMCPEAVVVMSGKELYAGYLFSLDQLHGCLAKLCKASDQ